MELYICLLLFISSFCHSSLGLGGGTSYNALFFVLYDDLQQTRYMALLLNILVSLIVLYQFRSYIKESLSRIMPFLISSIPCAYLGGRLLLSKEIFNIVISIFLIYSLVAFFNARFVISVKRVSFLSSLLIGAVLGFTAGLIGIGGGIFLLPILLACNLALRKVASCMVALFILCNSCVSLFVITSAKFSFTEIHLFLLVVLGGILGSFCGLRYFSDKTVKYTLSLVILFVIIRINFI